MRFIVIFVVTVLVKNVSSKPQVDSSGILTTQNVNQQVNEATQNAANVFDEAIKNGVDLPTNLQNSLQSLRNNTRNNNGADLPSLSQILGETPSLAASGQNPLPSLNPAGQTLPQSIPSLPNLAQNIPSLIQAAENLPGIPSNLGEAGQNFAQNLTPSLKQVAQNVPANNVPTLANLQTLNQADQNLPANNVFPSVPPLPNSVQNLPGLNPTGQNRPANNLGQPRPSPQLPTLTSVIPNLASNAQNNLGQSQERLPQFSSTQSPLINSPSLTSLLPNFQFDLDQFPQLASLNQAGSRLQNQPLLPSLQNIPRLTSAFRQYALPQNQQSAFPSPSPTLTSGQNIPGSSLPLNNSSSMGFDLEEENGSEVSEQRRGQMTNPGNTKGKNWPLFNQNPQQNYPGGLLNNLYQFTDKQIQTNRDALRDTTRNLLELTKLRHQGNRLLRQQQKLGGLLGNGGLDGGLSSPLGILSGNPLETSENKQATNEAANPSLSSGILGPNSQGLGLRNLGGLVGIGRK